MAQVDRTAPEAPPRPPSPPSGRPSLLRKLFGRQRVSEAPAPLASEAPPTEHRPERLVDGAAVEPPAATPRRACGAVVPRLPRAQTLTRPLSEQRDRLTPVETTPEERRAMSADTPTQSVWTRPPSEGPSDRGPSPTGCAYRDPLGDTPPYPASLSLSLSEDAVVEERLVRALPGDADLDSLCGGRPALSVADTGSLNTAEYDALIHGELQSVWILNLSLHFRDRSNCEKFFVTYRPQEHLWRRVTISVDYRRAPPDSLEMDLDCTQLQSDKNAKIYEALRESLPDIQFYATVTNLKLQTIGGRLHVHVVEDGKEIIPFPPVTAIQHLACPHIRERDVVFDSHMSGFVYKVSVSGVPLIKKEIPSPSTVDEFLYEINALQRLRFSSNVIHFYGVVVDDDDESLRGILLSYAEEGALVDIIYDRCKVGNSGLDWALRETWARQIVQGLADLHESGFVQGDFTLSNIVVDGRGDAKIIDINRRGCPVGWEPPEAIPLIESKQRIFLYIGVKSDLYQLGMVLWALAMQEDEPEMCRPLALDPDSQVPEWYRKVTNICLSSDPRFRLPASSLLRMFPVLPPGQLGALEGLSPTILMEGGHTMHHGLVNGCCTDGPSQIITAEPQDDWFSVNKAYAGSAVFASRPYCRPRGRSPPSPLPSHSDRCESRSVQPGTRAWHLDDVSPSYADICAHETPQVVWPPPHDLLLSPVEAEPPHPRGVSRDYVSFDAHDFQQVAEPVTAGAHAEDATAACTLEVESEPPILPSPSAMGAERADAASLNPVAEAATPGELELDHRTVAPSQSADSIGSVLDSPSDVGPFGNQQGSKGPQDGGTGQDVAPSLDTCGETGEADHETGAFASKMSPGEAAEFRSGEDANMERQQVGYTAARETPPWIEN